MEKRHPAVDSDEEHREKGEVGKNHQEAIMVEHSGSKREIEPDYSGYVDEYRFIPLTPSLEKALARMVEKHEIEGRDEARELEGMGYIRDLAFYLGNAYSFELTAKGRRYAGELAAYRQRRDRWAADRDAERKRNLWVQFAQGLITTLAGAAIGAAATLVAVG